MGGIFCRIFAPAEEGHGVRWFVRQHFLIRVTGEQLSPALVFLQPAIGNGPQLETFKRPIRAGESAPIESLLAKDLPLLVEIEGDNFHGPARHLIEQ